MGKIVSWIFGISGVWDIPKTISYLHWEPMGLLESLQTLYGLRRSCALRSMLWPRLFSIRQHNIVQTTLRFKYIDDGTENLNYQQDNRSANHTRTCCEAIPVHHLLLDLSTSALAPRGNRRAGPWAKSWQIICPRWITVRLIRTAPSEEYISMGWRVSEQDFSFGIG